MEDLLPAGRPVLVLAPMQDVTDLPFMRVMERFGGPDLYVTEYFRVYEGSRLSPWILRSIDENPTGKPVFAQMIGQDLPALVRTARELEAHPVAGIDLNLGCPAPDACRKEAGGGLLRDPANTLRDTHSSESIVWVSGAPLIRRRGCPAIPRVGVRQSLGVRQSRVGVRQSPRGCPAIPIISLVASKQASQASLFSLATREPDRLGSFQRAPCRCLESSDRSANTPNRRHYFLVAWS